MAYGIWLCSWTLLNTFSLGTFGVPCGHPLRPRYADGSILFEDSRLQGANRITSMEIDPVRHDGWAGRQGEVPRRQVSLVDL